MRQLNDKKLKFYEKKHRYNVGKKELTSVTTFISTLFEKFDEKDMARKLNKMKGTKWYKLGVRKILKLWQDKREYGTLVHNQIETFINSEKMLDEHNTDPKAKQAINYYLKTMSELDTPTPYAELRIYSEKYGLAGTIDLLITHNDEGERKATLVDWKTNEKFTTTGYNGKKGISKYTKNFDDCHLHKYGLQLMIYSKILEEEYGYKINKNLLVHLTDNEVTAYEVKYEILFELVNKILEERKTEWQRKKMNKD